MTYCIVGLGYGDEGKGSIVDFLVRYVSARQVGRFSGGAQALHHVHLLNGTIHGFHQFSSGTFAGAQTELGPNVIIDPGGMLIEAEEISRKTGNPRPQDLMTVDPECVIATPYHREINRLSEIARSNTTGRYGTTGMGVGEALLDARKGYPSLRAKDIISDGLSKLLETIQDRQIEKAKQLGFGIRKGNIDQLVDYYRKWANTFTIVPTCWNEYPPDILEGSQGTLLDPTYGFEPYTTKARVTVHEAQEAIPTSEIQAIGVIRGYSTRHGRGPFPTEDSTFSPKVAEDNKYNEWQEYFRVGPLDLVTLRYSTSVCGKLWGLAVTCLDCLDYPLKVCIGYRCEHKHARKFLSDFENGVYHRLNAISPEMISFSPHAGEIRTSVLFECDPVIITVENENKLLNLIEEYTGVRVFIISHGPTFREKRWL